MEEEIVLNFQKIISLMRKEKPIELFIMEVKFIRHKQLFQSLMVQEMKLS